MRRALGIAVALAAGPALADETRQLDAHEHGVGTLNIAIEADSVAMEFTAPGADIVGFEYQAESDEDLAAIETAKTLLQAPLDLFTIPDAADCTIAEVDVELEGNAHHEEHDGHDHADHGHDDHDDAHDHDHTEAHEGHAEFHATYLLECENVTEVSQITFAYFDAFPNAREVEVQLISETGARAYEVTRAAPVLDLER
ncbi:zinc uptake protein ZrgA [Pontivivens insulae]|uniref:Zinc-binding protein n=1 Tax=Pontivivens insulae TaxID=1639689 RepID=A0A2R8A6W6_9RHOB|nr:DUF2796 domain-containing protein [Pontivivens insulae]RED18082.1 uncharacterized protein DUF2796 [Pontivivens insulae]SPF27979.1 hypothetical protein POI8812_00274 [Pontivivens insulae]